MIQTLYDYYSHSTIAVVGSSPTSILYQGKEDVSIALNAAALLKQPFTYHMMFDKHCPNYEWWNCRKDVIRLIGANLARQDLCLYDECVKVETKIKHLEDEWLEANPPKHPHLFWYYKHSQRPQLLKPNYLSHDGTVAHAAVELAFYMGADRINLYGIELGTQGYEGYARYMNQLIKLIKEKGALVFRAPSKLSKLFEAQTLGE